MVGAFSFWGHTPRSYLNRLFAPNGPIPFVLYNFWLRVRVVKARPFPSTQRSASVFFNDRVSPFPRFPKFFFGLCRTSGFAYV